MSYEFRQRTKRSLAPGSAHPRGASLAPNGVNFALYSEHAFEVWLLLFDRPDGEPTDVIRVKERTQLVWHVFVAGLKAGQLYGYRVRGPYDPARGLRFNEAKLLMDPCAKALTGKFDVGPALLGYDAASPLKDLRADDRDDSSLVPKSIVVDDAFDWQGDRPPEVPFEDTVIYEAHVKGFTAHPSSGVSRPGTYLGFAEKVPYLKSLGITAVELLPVHEFVVEGFLKERGLTNFWGYNSIGFFAPESSYAAGKEPGAQVGEFKALVRELHRAGIEVILDVVYNHTGEGSELGPTLCLRGIDNPSYYALRGPDGEPGRFYENHSGCGNTLNLAHPAALRLVMDSLRYWVEVMHVDGFRFDLASVLGRENGGYRKSAAFFETVSQDPALSRVKLIAEPWDVGTYQLGNFPVDWAEWNGKFRDAMRRFARGDEGMLREVGWRLTGSADLYGHDGRSAYHSINFITCHDGFTLADLVSYSGKRNEANGEGNRDGADENFSFSGGAEGETADPAVRSLRLRLAKNHLCHLFLACGTPMLLAGDELLRSQRGNNNAYCQDNALGWLDWSLAQGNADFLDFFRRLAGLRRRFGILRRGKFFDASDSDGDGVPDISWFGGDLGPPAWEDPACRTLACMLDGEGGAGSPEDYRLFLILNADPELRYVRLPEPGPGWRWRRVLDTSLPAGREIAAEGTEVLLEPQDHYLVNGRSVVLLRAP
ncbi:MAG TPA: glycogen debranching protein GlgX [Elusimicrobiota bacterium]|nr:glycogen debranching protein GlgX [Elusimicrobiota bacterium]